MLCLEYPASGMQSLSLYPKRFPAIKTYTPFAVWLSYVTENGAVFTAPFFDSLKRRCKNSPDRQKTQMNRVLSVFKAFKQIKFKVKTQKWVFSKNIRFLTLNKPRLYRTLVRRRASVCPFWSIFSYLLRLRGCKKTHASFFTAPFFVM